MADYVSMLAGVPGFEGGLGALVLGVGNISGLPNPGNLPSGLEVVSGPDGQLLPTPPRLIPTPAPVLPLPNQNTPQANKNSPYTSDGLYTYSGTDVQILIEEPLSGRRRRMQQVQTLTVSVHRAHGPVRACGYVGIKGLAPGFRTVAGTIIFTQSDQDVLFDLVDAIYSEKARDSSYSKIDQLKPVNLTILLSNEYGFVSYRRLLGVKFLTDGTVYSVHDAFSENTVSYMAADFTPLLRVEVDPLGDVLVRDKLDDTQGRTFRDIVFEQRLLQATRLTNA